MRRGYLLAWLVAAVMVVGGPSAPASACSMDAPPHIDDIVPGAQVRGFSQDVFVGVYEFEFVARSPGFIILGPRAATVVTRYWGEPPSNLSVQKVGDDFGGFIGGSNCGVDVRDKGEVGYWYTDSRSVDRSDWPRSSLTFAGVTGTLTSSQESLLEARFGPPVELGVSPLDRLWGIAVAWRWELGALFAVAGFIAVVSVFRRRQLRRREGWITELEWPESKTRDS